MQELPTDTSAIFMRFLARYVTITPFDVTASQQTFTRRGYRILEAYQRVQHVHQGEQDARPLSHTCASLALLLRSIPWTETTYGE